MSSLIVFAMVIAVFASATGFVAYDAYRDGMNIWRKEGQKQGSSTCQQVCALIRSYR